MSRPRTCPHCHRLIPIDHGFHFDEALNMVHDACGKVVFAVNETDETKHFPIRSYGYTVRSATGTTTSYSYGSQYNHQPSQYSQQHQQQQWGGHSHLGD